MNATACQSNNRAFTVIELLVVVAILGIVLAMYLPTIHRGCREPGVVCMNNLKQVGLGLVMYASDHADHFPWQISLNSTVSREAVESRPTAEHFLVLSNYALRLPVYVCPTDKTRAVATNYATFSNSNLSYFAVLSATAASGSNVWQLILAGDRHLSVDGQVVKSGFCALNEHSSPGWTKELHKPEHNLTHGTLLFADGHAQFVPAKNLPKMFKDQPVAASRLVVP